MGACDVEYLLGNGLIHAQVQLNVIVVDIYQMLQVYVAPIGGIADERRC